MRREELSTDKQRACCKEKTYILKTSVYTYSKSIHKSSIKTQQERLGDEYYAPICNNCPKI